MTLYVTFTRGHFLGLQAALEGCGCAGKLKEVVLSTGEIITDMSGEKAPEFWKKGEREAVLEPSPIFVSGKQILASPVIMS
ncbi:MAG: hypothetical protein JRG88_11445 [Deltaproteobacteria bacterium]|nr:hypothetical protein [Deltaproteobacteria bacterium]MBW2133128.1 hypothetical protein [Deltaproteobacteria bacterium]